MLRIKGSTPMKIVLLLLVVIHQYSTLGIQVYEDHENDTTTMPPTMLAPPKSTEETVLPTMSMEMSSTTAESRIVETHSTTENSVIPMATPTKSSRIQLHLKPKKESFRQDQQQRSTSTVSNKNFVPSQQISAVVTPLASAADYTRDTVVPLNAFHKTTNPYDPQPFLPYPSFATQSPHQLGVPFDTPNYYNPQPKTSGDHFAITNPWNITPATHDQGKWYWMPVGSADGLLPTSTLAPSPPPIPPHWKWMFENKFNEHPGASSAGGPDCCGQLGGEVYIRPTPSEVPHSEHPFSFDPVDAAKFGQPPPRPLSPHYHHQNPATDIGGLISTQVSEVEFDHIVKGSLVEHGGTDVKGKKRAKAPSPWKKILHVLSAAIPIGLLISAFTPQYVYVDPNSTMSLGQQQIPQQQPKRQPPFDSGKYENRHDHYNHHYNPIHRALTDGEITGSPGVDLFVPTNETLANLFVEVNALFANHDQFSASTNDNTKSGNDNKKRPRHRQQLRHRKQGTNNNSSSSHHADNMDDQHHETASAASAPCQYRDICDIAILGAAPNSHVVHRMMWMLANELEERPNINESTRRLFSSVRDRNCSRLDCEQEALPATTQRKVK